MRTPESRGLEIALFMERPLLRVLLLFACFFEELLTYEMM